MGAPFGRHAALRLFHLYFHGTTRHKFGWMLIGKAEVRKRSMDYCFHRMDIFQFVMENKNLSKYLLYTLFQDGRTQLLQRHVSRYQEMYDVVIYFGFPHSSRKIAR